MTIEETKEHEQLIELFIRNGLEYSGDTPTEEEIVKCWKVERDRQLIAGCMLVNREGKYIVAGLVVEAAYRKNNIGSNLLNTAVNYVKEQQACKVYLVAKVPAFFQRHGFKTLEIDKSPITIECLTCHQYKNSCFPEVMEIDF